MSPEEVIKELSEKMEGLETQAAELLERAEKNPSEAADVKAVLENEIQPKLAELTEEREKNLAAAEVKELRGKVSTLTEAIEELRKPPEGFEGGVPVERNEGKSLYADGEHSFYSDIALARKGDRKAADRLETFEAEGKAMTEGTDSAGGFLVPDEISSELLELKVAKATLRPLFSAIQVQSDKLRIASVTGGLTAAWVAELAAKPSADLTFGEISTSVFTGAGLAVASNQLIKDSPRAVDALVNRDLAKRLRNLEEIAFLTGSGTGQPRGILNTAGIGGTTYTDATPTVPELLDNIYSSIVDVQTDFQEEPTDIVLHPRTWGWIVNDRQADGHYTIGSGANSGGRRASDALPERTLHGYRVTLCPNIPTNLGAGTNESVVIVGAFNEGLILDREGIVTDQSEHVYFTTNQTVFRSEFRVGFTAARYPAAFSVVSGTGLATH